MLRKREKHGKRRKRVNVNPNRGKHSSYVVKLVEGRLLEALLLTTVEQGRWA